MKTNAAPTRDCEWNKRRVTSLTVWSEKIRPEVPLKIAEK